MWGHLILVFVEIFINVVVGGVQITNLSVPSRAIAGDQVHLECDYTLDTLTSLYSLKWYKDGQEFYRHVRGIGQSASQRCSEAATSPAPAGVNIDCWVSTEREVVLKDVTSHTSGEYRCEVIGDHPGFRKEERRQSLTVYSEPIREPSIRTRSYKYELGELVSLNCTSNNHEYNPTLTWYINGQTYKDHELHYNPPSKGTVIGIQFTADRNYFSNGQSEVACKASVGATHEKTAAKTLSIPSMLSPQYYSQGTPTTPNFCLSFPLFIILMGVFV